MPDPTPAATTPPAPATPPAAATAATPSLLSQPPAAPAAGSTTTPTDATKGEPAKATEAPDYDIKLPPGVEANAALLGEFKPLAKELGLKGEAAQKLMDLHVKALSQAEATSRATQEQTQKTWVESVKADKEYGGAQFDQNIKVAQQAIAKFGGPELQRALNESGFGNHPELVRFAYRIGKALAEDSVGGSSAGPNTDTSQEAVLRRRYPTMYPKDT